MVTLAKVNLKDYLFISYAHDDHEFAEKFVADLKTNSFVIWIDSEGLQPGTRNWEDSIREAISSAVAVLLIASPSSRQSTYVQDELAIARMYHRPIFPIWAEGAEWIDSIPMGMGKMQYIDARAAETYGRGLKKLVPTLTALKLSSGHGRPADVPSSEAAPVQEPEPKAEFQPRNPYKGLRAFREDEQDDFFGRERFLDELLATLVENSQARILPIIGPSGSGK
jgi:TIR domain/Novel STAND NTPase 1